jgi:N-acetylneuraminate synthase
MSDGRTLIIAEIGVNHNGDLDLAKAMVDAAAEADVDVIKFQSFVPELLMLDSAPKAAYQEQTTGTESSAMDMIAALQFGYDDFRELKTYVEATGKVFLSTAFDLPSLAFLSELGLTTFKIPSGEITNLPYLRAMAGYADDIIMSTGMCDMGDIRAAFTALTAAGFPADRLTVLQCNTAYPSPADDANLRAMITIGDDLGVAYGYSDHTEGPNAALAAVALGATVIEKHFTTDRTLPGPDQGASMEPDDFARLVRDIREIERSLGSSEKSITPSERENRPIARRGVYAARELAAGEVLGWDDVVCLRPESGMSPMDLDSVIGKPLVRALALHEPVDPTAVGDRPTPTR